MPSSSGIWTSIKTMSNSSRARRSIASRPVRAITLVWPRRASSVRISSWLSGLSSATSTCEMRRGPPAVPAAASPTDEGSCSPISSAWHRARSRSRCVRGFVTAPTPAVRQRDTLGRSSSVVSSITIAGVSSPLRTSEAATSKPSSSARRAACSTMANGSSCALRTRSIASAPVAVSSTRRGPTRAASVRRRHASSGSRRPPGPDARAVHREG